MKPPTGYPLPWRVDEYGDVVDANNNPVDLLASYGELGTFVVAAVNTYAERSEQ